jgi:polysulfide reductase chain C
MELNWGLAIAIYLYVAAMAGGAYVAAALCCIFGPEEHRKTTCYGYLYAIPLLIIGSIALIVDLGQPTRFLNLLSVFKFNSPMSAGAWALLVFGFFCVVSSIFTLSEDGKEGVFNTLANWISALVPRKEVAAIGSMVAIFLMAYTGTLLNSTSVPMWSETPLLSGLFLASGISTGVALMLLVNRKITFVPQLYALEELDNIAIILELAILFFFVLMLRREIGPDGHSLSHALVSGKLGAWFWIGAVIVGMILPLLINFFSGMKHKEGGKAPSILSPILILVGGFILRVVIVYAGQVGLG